MTTQLKINLMQEKIFEDMTEIQKDVLRGIQKIANGKGITKFELKIAWEDGMMIDHSSKVFRTI